MKTRFLIIIGAAITLAIVIGILFFQEHKDSVRINGRYIDIDSEYSCAIISLERLSPDALQEYESEGYRFVSVSDAEIKNLPVLEELITVTHKIDFPTKNHSQTTMNLREFVDYEFFIMDKAISKYGDTQDDYFSKLDSNLDERLADPKKQGFANEFNAPQIIYHDKAYSLSGTVFWTSDEDEDHQLTVRMDDSIQNDSKFVTLTDEDMKSIPKLKQIIDVLGTEKDNIYASKGVKENPDWNNYRQWFEGKIRDAGIEDFKALGLVYNGEYYSLNFPIC